MKTVGVIKLKEIYNKIQGKPSTNPYTLYCDLDGVLADFEKRFEDKVGMSPKKYKDINGIDKFWKTIDDEGAGFWIGIPWMPDGEQLWDYIKPFKPTILSSPSWDNSSRLGKRVWVKNRMPDTKLILSFRAKKKQYSKKNSILIDDLKLTIDEWNAGGGIGILHTSTASTIKQLKELGL